MIPYTRHEVTADDEMAVRYALRSDHLTQGPEVEALEWELAAMSGAKYAVVVSSGTAALTLAYRATSWPHSYKDKTLVPTIRVPAISFVATANAACLSAFYPEFADVDPTTGLAGRGAPVAVTLGGQPLTGWITDACHGPIRHADGGCLATCLSFHPAKHVAAGEGGAILTNDREFADQCRLLRSHGRDGTSMVALGYNFRMPEINAALARSQLKRYEQGVLARRRRAAIYDAAFEGHPSITPVPHSPDSARHLYQVLVENRDQIQTMLRARGIGTAVHYPVIPLQPYYRERYGYRPGQFPGAEAHAARTLSIPLYPSLTEEDQQSVITALLDVCA